MRIWSETGTVFNNRDDNYNLPTIEELLRGFATKDPKPKLHGSRDREDSFRGKG